ncbi:MAG: DNA-directed RNA polymerase subunit alpha [bacterium]
MNDQNIVLPSKPRIIKEDGSVGIYEIDGLYPGYGHTLGNSLRRIILSSLPGAAITSVKITGVSHEFSTIEGVKEDVITILLNLKKIRIQLLSDEPQVMTLRVKGVKNATGADIEAPGQVVIVNKEQHIASVTDKNTTLEIEITAQKGLGYVPKEVIQKERVDIGSIALDAIFTPIKRANYEVENMRVGNRTDFNRIKLFIETDGTITPHEALEQSIVTMIEQLKAIVGFKEEEIAPAEEMSAKADADDASDKSSKKEIDPELLKTRIETLDLSPRTLNALTSANVRTLGGLVRKKEEDILDIDGLGSKGVQEIKKFLNKYGISLK